MNDKDIVRLFFERSQQAITELSQKYGKLCFRIALNILKCNEDAEECENDTYLKAWNSIPPDTPMCLKAYVSRIVRNLALSKYRYNHRQMRDSAGQVMAAQIREHVERLLEELFPPKNIRPTVEGMEENVPHEVYGELPKGAEEFSRCFLPIYRKKTRSKKSGRLWRGRRSFMTIFTQGRFGLRRDKRFP